jgi:CRISPR/Cas system CSM-associated protein Csm3 (group 7 of RAMP superfamily)
VVYNFVKVRIEAKLTTESELFVGSGLSLKNQDDQEEAQFCLDYQGNPYIPASTLRGALRARAPLDLEKLFGTLGTQTTESRIRVFNAFAVGDDMSSTTSKTTLRYGTQLLPRSRTVKPHHLFVKSVVPTGLHFSFLVEISDTSKEEVSAFLGILSEFSGSDLNSTIGGSKRKGLGRISLSDTVVRVITYEALTAWAEKDTLDLPLPYEESNLTDFTTTVQNSEDATTITFGSSKFTDEHYTANFKLQLLAPLLIASGINKDTDRANILRTVTDRNDYPFIPGKTILGALRGQARRILYTISINLFNELYPRRATPEEEKKIEELIDTKFMKTIFGDTSRAGALLVSDANIPKCDTGDKFALPVSIVLRVALRVAHSFQLKELPLCIYIRVSTTIQTLLVNLLLRKLI